MRSARLCRRGASPWNLGCTPLHICFPHTFSLQCLGSLGSHRQPPPTLQRQDCRGTLWHQGSSASLSSRTPGATCFIPHSVTSLLHHTTPTGRQNHHVHFADEEITGMHLTWAWPSSHIRLFDKLRPCPFPTSSLLKQRSVQAADREWEDNLTSKRLRTGAG